MKDDFLNELLAGLKDSRVAKTRRRILTEIAGRLEGHDFCGEILEDRWIDNVAPQAFGYLSDDETAALDATENLPPDAAGSGSQVVLRAFVIYLCRLYKVTPSDLE